MQSLAQRLPFYAGLGLVTASTLMLQIVETRIISVTSWYHLAFFIISIAMFGLTVGAVDENRTPGYWADDFIPTWSAVGPTADGFIKPDLVAPGANIITFMHGNPSDPALSQKIVRMHPDYSETTSLFRMSGTSMSTAITAGVAALILQANPRLTPDQVKAFLRDNAFSLKGPSALSQGSGELNLTAMLAANPPSKYTQKFHSGSGTGSLEVARGQDHLTRDGVVLTGEQDIFGQPFNAAAMAKLEGSASSWSGGKWNGSTWSGNPTAFCTSWVG